MKKLLLATSIMLSVASYAQKEELKTLKKIYSKSNVSDKDLETYKTTLASLESLATEEGDKVYTKFYKNMYPTLVLASKGTNATLQDQINVYQPDFITNYGKTIDETIEYETKTGKKVYTDELIQEKADFKNQLNNIASTAYGNGKYKEAASLFYAKYLFDPKNEGQALENASIAAVQSQDYVLAEKMYEELKKSDYLNNGTKYFAVSKVSGEVDSYTSKADRDRMVKIGSHDKPSEEKVSKQKPEIYKTLALIYVQNGKLVEAKKALAEARELSPNDEDIKKEEARLYFNDAYELLKDDQKLVDEINANLANKAKYDELMAKRKSNFSTAMPSFEKAYSLNPSDENTKILLKMTYEILGMKEKADSIK